MEKSLVLYKPQSKKARKNNFKVTIVQLTIALLIISIIPNGAALTNLVSYSQFLINNYIKETFYVFNGSGVDFYMVSSSNNDEVRNKILEGLEQVKINLGPPAYSGRVIINFNKDSNYGRVKPFNSLVGREISFPSINEFLNLDNKRYFHELIHTTHSDDDAYYNLPDFVIEGVTEALSHTYTDEKDFFLNEYMENYYMKDLSGFVDPDVDFESLPVIKRELYYYSGRIFFKRLFEIDELLLTEILRNPPNKKTKWKDFTQWLLTITNRPDELRDMINETYIFSPLTKKLYIVPIMKLDGVITLHIFLKDSKSSKGNINCSLKNVKIKSTLNKGVFIDNGYLRLEIPWPSNEQIGEIKFEMNTPGKNYNQIIKLERRKS